MSEARINSISNEQGTGGPTISGITTFSGTNYFVPPVGNTAERPENPQKGALRFNTDSAHLEYFKGDSLGWVEVEASNEELNGGYRGVFGMRAEPSITDSIDYITISTAGNAQDFGNSTDSRYTYSTCASATRGFMAGGAFSLVDTIDYITFSQTGNAIDFGNLTQSRWVMCQGCASSTRGLFAGGLDPGPSTTYNIIDYITMASTGNANDFGDLVGTRRMGSACQSTTRGVWSGGYTPSSTNVIEYVTIATTGNTSDFGDMSYNFRDGGGTSNSTRGIWFGGSNPGVNTISYITIASTGNALDFGDLDNLKANGGACSSPTRAVYGGGLAPGNKNNIEYIEIPTTGNALDFGDLVAAGHNLQAFSNGHGGL